MLTVNETMLTPISFRHETLVSLLNKLSTQFYDLSPLELDQRRSVNPEYIKKLHINKTWYLSQITTKCRTNFCGNELAELLSRLDYEELTLIMSHRDFNPLLLKNCIEYAMDLIKDDEPVLLKASVFCLLKIVANFRGLFPKPHQVFKVFGREATSSEIKYSNRVTEIFSENMFFNFFYNTMSPLTCYVTSLPLFPTIKIPDESFEDLIKFAVICLEFVNYLLCDSSLNVNFIDNAINCANSIFKEIHLCSILALDTHVSWLCSAINSIYKLVNVFLQDAEPLPLLPKNNLKSTLENLETASAGHACYQASILIEWLSKKRNKTNIPKFLYKTIKSIIISLSRLPLINSYVLIPPTAWKTGWQSELSGTFNTQASLLPIEHFQDIDILEEFIFRINLLGWTSRQQFEETWMCFLSVLCYTPPTEMEMQEMTSRATSLAVQAITSLLIQTLFFPLPSNRNVSKLLHVPRNRDIICNTIALKKLRDVQFVLHLKYKNSLNLVKSVVNVFENHDLERLNDKYTYGQFSTEYLMLAVGIASVYNENTAAGVVLKRRKVVLEESGLDVNSCLQFLLDLYSQWTKNEVSLGFMHKFSFFFS